MKSEKRKGFAASPGIGFGSVFVHRLASDFIFRETIPTVAVPGEVQRFREAVQRSIHELTLLKEGMEKGKGKGAGLIIESQILLLQDEELVRTVSQTIEEEKVRAEWALHLLRRRYRDLFQEMDNEYIRGRIADINDAFNRLLGNLNGHSHPCPEAPPSLPIILVADDLLPSEMGLFITSCRVAGIVLMKGGSHSHAVILARAFEIPAVIGIGPISMENLENTDAIVDGTVGEVIFTPSLKVKREYGNRKEQFSRYIESLKAVRLLPSRTKDGVPFKTSANIELPEEVEMALSYGAEGIGLFRTEFLYLFRPTPPTEEEHYKVYSRLVSEMAGRPLVVRTLDVGGEKQGSLFAIGREDNPALGLRAVRYFLKEREILEVQLKALLRAAREGKIKILFPMVTELEELRELKEIVETLARKEGVGREMYDVGMMVEVPSAALLMDQFSKEVDFVSVGTNDLIQYTLAVDRANSQVQHLYQPFNPAVLRLLAMVVKEAEPRGVEVQLCGEMAANPLSALVLVGLGIRSLSMSPLSIPLVKGTLTSARSSHLRAVAKEALKLGTASEGRESVVESLMRRCPGLLLKNPKPYKPGS